MASKANSRSEGRSNVFLAATLDTGTKGIPVRIRNISQSGAQVDSPSLPAVGTRVRLMRGKLSAVGKVAWVGKKQGGLTFDVEVDVASWVQRVGHAGQQRIDGVVAALRSSRRVPAEVHDAPGKQDSLPLISAALDQVCERLANAPGMSVELGEDLLKLDTIAQSLRRLATGSAY